MIPVLKPKYGEAEEAAVAEVLRSGWSGLGPTTAKFEDEFAKFIGGNVFVVGMNSCTSALHMAMALLDLKQGDEVIIPALNFVSGAHAITYCGAVPVWADVDPNMLCVDPQDISRKITNCTKAIVVMHYGGTPCDLNAIKKVAGDLPIIEDAAHSCGAYYLGSRIGSMNTTCFSFHAVKNLSMGEGGAFVTADRQLYDKALKFRWLGIDKSTCARSSTKNYAWAYNVEFVGCKSHLSDISAAIGLVQLKNLDIANSDRRHIGLKYRELLQNKPGIELLSKTSGGVTAQHLFVVKVDPGKRDSIIANLAENGIGTSVHYTPIYRHKVYRTEDHKCPNTESVADSILSLPLHLWLNDDDIEHISTTLIKAVS